MTNLADWVIESTTSVGTGDVVLEGTTESWARFQDAMGAGDVWYSILNNTNREAGIGAFDGNNVLSRHTVMATLVDGVYNGASPPPISLVGDSTVGCTYNANAQRENEDKFTQTEILSLLAGKVSTVAAGDNIAVDAGDPENPVVSVPQALFDAKENSLPAVTNDNTFLSSLGDGTRSWALPVAKHSDTTDYVVNDVVIESGKIYTCIISHTGKPFDLTEWSPTVAAVGTGTQFKYKWSSSISGDPGTGFFSVNNIDISLATQVSISKTSRTGVDISAFISAWMTGEYVGFEEEGSNFETAFYQIAGDLIDNVTYYAIPVVFTTGAGDPDTNRDGIVSHILDPANKLPLGGDINQVLSKNSNSDYDTSWKDIAGGGGGQVNTVVGGVNLTVNSSDPINPVVNSLPFGSSANTLCEGNDARVVAVADKMSLDGSTPMTGDLSLGLNFITNILPGEFPGDAATFDQLSAKLDAVNGVSTGQYETIVPIPALAIDVSNGNVQSKSISADSTFTFTGWTANASAVDLYLTVTGTPVVTFTGVTFKTVPVLTAGLNVLTFTSINSGSVINGFIAKDFS